MSATGGGEMDPEMERAWRRHSLQIQNNLSGSTGLLHLSEASSGAPGTFRISLISEYFSGSGFLYGDLGIANGGAGTEISAGGSTLMLAGIDIGQIDASDFVFA